MKKESLTEDVEEFLVIFGVGLGVFRRHAVDVSHSQHQNKGSQLKFNFTNFNFYLNINKIKLKFFETYSEFERHFELSDRSGRTGYRVMKFDCFK